MACRDAAASISGEIDRTLLLDGEVTAVRTGWPSQLGVATAPLGPPPAEFCVGRSRNPTFCLCDLRLRTASTVLGSRPFAVQSRLEPRSPASRDARDRSLLQVQGHSKPKLQVVQSAGTEALAAQSHFEPKLAVVHKCVEPKPFAGEKMLGAEALRVQSGSGPKPFALQTWEEPKQASAQPILRCLFVGTAAGRSLWWKPPRWPKPP